MASDDKLYHEAMLLRDEPRLQAILPKGAILCGEKPVRVVLASDFDAMRQRAEKAEQALHEIRHANMNGPVSDNNAGCIKRIEQIAERALAGVKEGTA